VHGLRSLIDALGRSRSVRSVQIRLGERTMSMQAP